MFQYIEVIIAMNAVSIGSINSLKDNWIMFVH